MSIPWWVPLAGAALLLAVLLVPCPCPADTVQVALWEWQDGGWLLAEGGGVLLVGDVRAATWSSDREISAVMVKGGEYCLTQAGGYAGTVSADETGGHDLSSVRFCIPRPTAVRLASLGGRVVDAAGLALAVVLVYGILAAAGVGACAWWCADRWMR